MLQSIKKKKQSYAEKKEKGKIVKMLLDEANDFSCATANDVAFKMFYLPSSFKILKGSLLKYMLFWCRTFEIPSLGYSF